MSAVALGLIATIVLPVLGAFMKGEALIAEAFGQIGGYELELSFETDEEIDLTIFRNQNAKAIASFLAKGNDEKKEQYLKVLESGLKTKLTFIHSGEDGTSYSSIFFESGRATPSKYSAVASVSLFRDDPSSLSEAKASEIESDDTGNSGNPSGNSKN